MYLISSYFPTRSAVLCIGDTAQYSENEMRYSAYRDKMGFALYCFRRLRSRRTDSEKKFSGSRLSSDCKCPILGVTTMPCRNRITIHIHPRYVRQLSDLPFFECPRDFILLIAWLRYATYVTEYVTFGEYCFPCTPRSIHISIPSRSVSSPVDRHVDGAAQKPHSSDSTA